MGAGEGEAQLRESIEGAGGRWMLPLVCGWAGLLLARLGRFENWL
jgi:hypothetical protein